MTPGEQSQPHRGKEWAGGGERGHGTHPSWVDIVLQNISPFIRVYSKTKTSYVGCGAAAVVLFKSAPILVQYVPWGISARLVNFHSHQFRPFYPPSNKRTLSLGAKVTFLRSTIGERHPNPGGNEIEMFSVVDGRTLI